MVSLIRRQPGAPDRPHRTGLPRERAREESGVTWLSMGYNPHRKRVKRSSDIVFVGAAVLITVALVIWGLFG